MVDKSNATLTPDCMLFSCCFYWPAVFFFHCAVLVVLFSVYSFDLLWFIYGFIITLGITGCISSESLDAQALVKLFFQGDSGLVFCIVCFKNYLQIQSECYAPAHADLFS